MFLRFILEFMLQQGKRNLFASLFESLFNLHFYLNIAESSLIHVSSVRCIFPFLALSLLDL